MKLLASCAFLVLGGLGLQVACGPATTVGHAVIDCTKADQAQIEALIAQLSPLLAGDSPDWTTIEHDAIAAGETIGGCALVEVISAYTHPAPAAARATSTNLDAARATLEDFRARVANGATFHTAQGDL